MKKIVIFSLLLLLLSLNGYSQVFLGPKGGISLQKGNLLDGLTRAERTNLFTYPLNLGVALHMRVGRFFYIQPEVSYTRRGYKRQVFGLASDQTIFERYRVGTLYVLAEFGFFFTKGNFRGSVFVGPSIGIGAFGQTTREVHYKSVPIGVGAGLAFPNLFLNKTRLRLTDAGPVLPMTTAWS